MKKISAVLSVAAALTLAAGLAACGSSAKSTGADGKTLTKINFGYIGDFNGSSAIAVANKEGLWAKHGLQVSTKVFTTGPVQITALKAGSLDYGYIGPGAFWLPASGQSKIIAINTVGNADRVIAQPGITTLADLKGKKIGVPQGTSGDMILTLALEKAGLKATDVKLVPMDPSVIVTAFASHQIDAAGLWYPAINNIKVKVPNLVELAKDADFADQVSFPNAYVAADSQVTGHPDVVKEVDAVLREAEDYRAAHLQDAINDDAAMMHLSPTVVAADAANSKVYSSTELDGLTKDGTVNKWLTGMDKYFLGAGKLKTDADPSSFYLGDVYTSAGS